MKAYLRDADSKDVGYLALAGLITLLSTAAAPLVAVASFSFSAKVVNTLRKIIGA